MGGRFDTHAGIKMQRNQTRKQAWQAVQFDGDHGGHIPDPGVFVFKSDECQEYMFVGSHDTVGEPRDADRQCKVQREL